MQIKEFFDKDTYTLTYVVWQEGAGDAIVIDPVMDFDPASGKIFHHSVNAVMEFLQLNKLKPAMILETHAHADHISGSQLIKLKYPNSKIAIGERITEVQKIFSKTFNIDMPCDGRQFDILVKDNEVMEVAGLSIKEIPTPGHTPACSSYQIGNAVFTGDALFMPDYGVGRCDFPGGDAGDLFDSITKNLFTLPDETEVYTGHDYQPGGRELRFKSTIGEQKANNIFINAETTKIDFIERRKSRDVTLSAPRLLLPSIQVNIMAGLLPPPDTNGVRYLKTPLSIQAD